MIDLIALGGGLVINLGVAILGMLLLWLVAVRIRDVSFIDAVWAYGMVGLAWFSVARADKFTSSDRACAVKRPSRCKSSSSVRSTRSGCIVIFERALALAI